MEDQANKAIEQLLERAISGVDHAVEFSQAQIPDVVEQLLMWKMAESALSMAVSAIAYIVLFAFIKWVHVDLTKEQEEQDTRISSAKKYKPTLFKDSDGNIEPYVFATAIPAIIISAAGIGFFSLDWLQILIAPKLYLLEYAAELVK